jgi:alkanesulfonate monooxygenase SsuD/methylene tetrahydromethanopterin reductase-like flavin-dependent oxidoreductase (luciferase family)
MAGALSQIVRRAKIAVLGPTLPILNPVRVAEELAMIDTMSGGRVVAGMMRGTPNEYVTYNINPAESRERFAEALHLIRRAWTETRPFGWLGRYYQYRTISIWPRPVQQPHPPLYMSGSSPEAGEFAARNRIGIGFAFTTVPLAKSAVQHYRVCARDAGWEPAAEDVIYRAMFHVADTDEQAFADMSTLPPRISLVDQNKAIAEGVLQSGYYGADVVAQRQRTSRRELADRIGLGQVSLAAPTLCSHRCGASATSSAQAFSISSSARNSASEPCIRSSSLAQRFCRACGSFRRNDREHVRATLGRRKRPTLLGSRLGRGDRRDHRRRTASDPRSCTVG